jgi:hypothetical protein
MKHITSSRRLDKTRPLDSGFIAEIDRLQRENETLQDRRDALVLQCNLTAKALRQIADALSLSIKSQTH